MPQTVVLNKRDIVVSRSGKGDPLYLKSCKACSLLVEHLKVFRGSAGWQYVPLADHDSQCKG